MKAAHGFYAPSNSLLRFLRCQLHTQTGTNSAVAGRISIRPKVSLSRQCCGFTTTSPGKAAPITQSDRFSNHDRLSATSRDFTTSSLREGFWRKIRGPNDQHAKPFRAGDLPLKGALNDTPGLGGGSRMMLKPGNELKLRCTEFDENGNVVLVNGEFRKSELIQKVQLSICLRAMLPETLTRWL